MEEKRGRVNVMQCHKVLKQPRSQALPTLLPVLTPHKHEKQPLLGKGWEGGSTSFGCLLTFQCFIDRKIEADIGCYSQEGRADPSIETTTPESTFLPQDHLEGVSNAPVTTDDHFYTHAKTFQDGR